MNQSTVRISIWPGPRLNSPNTGGMSGTCCAPRPLTGPGPREVASRGGRRTPKIEYRISYIDAKVQLTVTLSQRTENSIKKPKFLLRLLVLGPVACWRFLIMSG